MDLHHLEGLSRLSFLNPLDPQHPLLPLDLEVPLLLHPQGLLHRSHPECLLHPQGLEDLWLLVDPHFQLDLALPLLPLGLPLDPSHLSVPLHLTEKVEVEER